MSSGSRCLIGTLYSGENEITACQRALRRQTYTNWSQVRLDHLTEFEAHRQLYQTFMAQADSFDLFIKIDADMILNRETALKDIIVYLKRRPRIGHACFALKDYMTNRPMMGLHVFSNRATWQIPESQYHPDQKPAVPGKRARVWGGPAPVADHANDPSALQAFHFGVHRTLKAMYGKRQSVRIRQWEVMHRVARHCQRNADPRLRLALLGGWHVWNGDLGWRARDANNPTKQALFAQYSQAGSAILDQALPEQWLWRLHKKCRRPLLDACVKRVRQARIHLPTRFASRNL